MNEFLSTIMGPSLRKGKKVPVLESGGHWVLGGGGGVDAPPPGWPRVPLSRPCGYLHARPGVVGCRGSSFLLSLG